MSSPDLRPWWIWTGVVAGVVACLWWFPLFRVVPLTAARQAAAGARFDPCAFVERFWQEDLPRVLPHAVETGVLWEGLVGDAAATAQRYGRRLGLSSVNTYLVAGTGRVTQVTAAAVTLTVGEPGSETTVIIETGPVFGNAIRDGSGLLDVNHFPNSQDFNAVSAELNRQVEEEVLPGLRARAVADARLRFVGCTEVTESPADGRPLRVVPIRIEWL